MKLPGSKLGISQPLKTGTANSRLGLYRQAGLSTAIFLLSPDVLRIETGDRPGLVDPASYYDLLIHSTPAQV